MGDKMNSSLVFGIGINDSETHISYGNNGKQLWICPFYSTWRDMLRRCYSAAGLIRKPSYLGCSVAIEWLAFSVFRDWMQQQDWQENHLDKDILSPGNKVYSPDTCVFIPPYLNKFLTDHGRARGEFPIGVSWNKDNRKFGARCSNPFLGKDEHIGYFVDPDNAHEAWRARKHEHALLYAGMQKDPRIAQALRTRFSPTKADAMAAADQLGSFA